MMMTRVQTLFDQVQQVRRQQNRRAGAAARDDRLAHPADAERVEARSAARRTAAPTASPHQAARDDHLLPHAARQLAGQRPLLAVQLELVDERLRARARSRRRGRAAPISRRCSSTVRYSNRCGSSGMNASRRLASMRRRVGADRSRRSARVPVGRPAGCPPASAASSSCRRRWDRSGRRFRRPRRRTTGRRRRRRRAVGARQVLDGDRHGCVRLRGFGGTNLRGYACIRAQSAPAESQEPRAQPPVPVAPAQCAEEHPHRHRRQRPGRRQDRR